MMTKCQKTTTHTCLLYTNICLIHFFSAFFSQKVFLFDIVFEQFHSFDPESCSGLRTRVHLSLVGINLIDVFHSNKCQLIK